MKATLVLILAFVSAAQSDAPTSSYAVLPYESRDPHHQASHAHHQQEPHHHSSYVAPQSSYGHPQRPSYGGYRASKGKNKGGSGFTNFVSAPWKMMKGAGNYMRGFFDDVKNKWYELQGSFLLTRGEHMKGIGQKYMKKAIDSNAHAKGNYQGHGGVIYGNSKPFTQGNPKGQFNPYHQQSFKGQPSHGYAAPQHSHQEVHPISGGYKTPQVSHGHQNFGNPKPSDIFHAGHPHAGGDSNLISQTYQQPSVPVHHDHSYSGSEAHASVAVPDNKHNAYQSTAQQVQQRSARQNNIYSHDVGRSYGIQSHVELPPDHPIPVPVAFYVQPSSLLIPQTFHEIPDNQGYH